MRAARILFFSLFLFVMSGFAEEGSRPAVVALKGHLGEAEMIIVQEDLSMIRASGNKTLIVEVDSTSGSLLDVLDVCKKLYEMKVESGIRVIVYIHGNALGPAAIIPFVADERAISLFVSWGDIVSGKGAVLSPNILRSRVRSLISRDDPHLSLLTLIAESMVDESLEIIDDGGWKIFRSDVVHSNKVVSSSGETLVVDHNQMRELQLVSSVMSQEAFYEKYGLSEKQQDKLESESIRSTTLTVSPDVLRERLADKILYNPNGNNLVGRIVIDDMKSGITQSTWVYVKSALDHYKKVKPAFIILELNTPGGEVYAAQRISDALQDFDTQYNIPTVAFIDNWAISAGAMLAYSCRFIGIVKDASMGAAAPVFISGGAMEAAPEKINSALRSDFSNRAGFYNRNPLIAEAMVDKDIILVVRHGEVVKLENEEQIELSGPDPDIVITTKGKLLTLDAKAMLEYGVADFAVMPQRMKEITPEEVKVGRWSGEKTLLFHYPFFSKISGVVVETYKMDWRSSFFAFLASPAVSSLLFLGLMIGFYTELNSPGFGVPGLVALTCLFFIVLSGFSLEASAWLEIILLTAGLTFLAVELLVLPGFGLAGILGIIFTFTGLAGLLLPGIRSVEFDFNTQTLNAAGQAVAERLLWLCGSIIVGVIIMIILSRYVMPKFRMLTYLVLEGEENSSDGYVAGLTPDDLPAVGSEGLVMAPLRPSGKVDIGDEVYDAVSQGDFVDKDVPVVVIAVEGSRLVVEARNEYTEL